MAMTNAEKQAAFRQRRDARIQELEAANLALVEENHRLRNGGHGPEILVWNDFSVMSGWPCWQTSTLKGGNYFAALADGGDAYEAHVTPWKNGRAGKTIKTLGTFATLDEAKAACTAHEKAITKAAPEPKAALDWIDAESGKSATSGPYFVNPYEGRFVAGYQPPKGPRGGRKMWEGLGNHGSLAEAKAACEKHARTVT
jgi:hypothetical protein